MSESITYFWSKKIYARKGRGDRETSSKNKLSNKPSCALITLEAITARKPHNFNGGYYKHSGKIVELITRRLLSRAESAPRLGEYHLASRGCIYWQWCLGVGRRPEGGPVPALDSDTKVACHTKA